MTELYDYGPLKEVWEQLSSKRRLFTYLFVFILLFSFTESAFCFHLRFGIACFRVATTPIGALIRCYVTSRLS